MAMDSLRGKVAIVARADTEVGKVPQFGATALCVDAARRALDDAGITKDQVDGLVTCNSMAEPHMYHAEAIAEYLQIFPRFCVSAIAGGGTTFSVLHHAAMAIESGVCDTVLISMATVCAPDCPVSRRWSCNPQPDIRSLKSRTVPPCQPITH